MPPAQLFHLHIPKTAGTSLRSSFDNYNHKILSIDSNFVYDPARHKHIDLFSGHAGYRALEASPNLKGRVITLLRDPFDRVMSYYFHLRESFRVGAEISERTDLANKYSLREFLAIKDHPHLIGDIYNAVTWQLIHDSQSHARMAFRMNQPALGESDLLALARKNLSSFLIVGFQDRIGEFGQAVSRVSGFPIMLGFDNVNKARSALDSLDAETKRRLRAWIEMDIAVHDWASSAFARR